MFGARTSRILSLVRMKLTSPRIGAVDFRSAGNSETGVVAGRISAGLALICGTGAFDFGLVSKQRWRYSSLRPSGNAMIGVASSRALRSETVEGTVWLS